MIKDFLWWVLKENVLINYIYREFLCFIFTCNKQRVIDKGSPVIDKSYILKTYRNEQPILALKGNSSGTTNTPLTVYRSIKSILLEEYIIKSYLKSLGVPISPRIAIFRGDDIQISRNVFWEKMPFTRRLIFSSYHLSESTASSYLKELEAYKPNIIMAYPSSITLLSKYAKKLNWQANWPVNVFTSSETFSLDNQEIVRSVFGNTCDHYGQAERVAALQQCIQGNYHVREDYSFVEFISDEHGIKIIGSNYHNKAMPLVRYDTHDYVKGLNQEGNCPCGNSSPYVKCIIGRDDDYVILSNGQQVGRLDVVFKGISGLIECQLEQVLLTKLIVRYVPDLNTSIASLEEAIEAGLKCRLGTGINISFEQVSKVPRTKAGKFKSVIRSQGIKSV